MPKLRKRPRQTIKKPHVGLLNQALGRSTCSFTACWHTTNTVHRRRDSSALGQTNSTICGKSVGAGGGAGPARCPGSAHHLPQGGGQLVEISALDHQRVSACA